MSIVNDLIKGRITFSQVATQIAQWADKVFASNGTATQFESATVSALKQGASNLVALADSELASHYDVMLASVTSAADVALAKVTGGLAIPAVPLMNQTIKDLAAAGKHALDVWALQSQAALNPPTTQPPLGMTVSAQLSGGIAKNGG